MKKLSMTKMADTIISKRKELKMTQVQLAEATGINRGMISRLESCDYTPSIDQLQAIGEVLNFEVVDLFEDDKADLAKVKLLIKSIILLLPVPVMWIIHCDASVSAQPCNGS